MGQAFKYTKPGGWIEFQDFDMRFHSSDGTFIPGCAVDEWSKEIILALEAMDREPEPGPKLEIWARDAGFQNINHQCLPIPVGIWPKDRRMVITLQYDPPVCVLADPVRRRKSGLAISRCFSKDSKPCLFAD
jgi:hypothetical protein